MTPDELKARSKRFALAIIAKTQKLSHTLVAQVISRQLVSAATSTAANYRAACRGKSKADVIAKLALVEEEADESLYWLDLLAESGIITQEKLSSLAKETEEILAMTVASIKTLRRPART